MKALQDKTLIICATAIICLIIAALVALSVSNHANDVSHYVGIFTPAVTGLVVLFGLRTKTKEAAENAQDFTDDQREEIESIVIRALADFNDGRRPPDHGTPRS